MQEHIAKADLPPEQKEAYAKAMKSVMAKMPKRALDRIHENLKVVGFHKDTKDAAIAAVDAASKTPGVSEKQLAAIAEWKKDLASGKRVMGGAYIKNKTAPEMHVDGDFKPNNQTTAGVYAHELGHAIDGPDAQASRSPQWQKAWEAEIKQGKLSKYATTDPSEGWAEFARAVYTEDPKEVEKQFPQCAAIFKAAKIWPS
jgi:hypothetical protein